VEFTCKDKTIHIKNGASVFEDIFERHVSWKNLICLNS
jgi:hypothetical protein